MADRTLDQAAQWISQQLIGCGWPQVRYSFLAKLETHVGSGPVEYFDCEATPAREREGGRIDAQATIVVFTASHLYLQTVHCLWRTKNFRASTRVIPRSALRTMTSAADDEVHVPWLARFCIWLGTWWAWLAQELEVLIENWATRSERIAAWYFDEEPSADVVVELTFADLADRVVTLPMSEHESSSSRLAQFLPSLTADLS